MMMTLIQWRNIHITKSRGQRDVSGREFSYEKSCTFSSRQHSQHAIASENVGKKTRKFFSGFVSNETVKITFFVLSPFQMCF